MMNFYIFLFILAIISIWISVFINLVFTLGAIGYFLDERKNKIDINKYNDQLPSVTILIPAHNEEKVIYTSLCNILNLNYPKDLVQIIVINDFSTDGTGRELNKIKKDYPKRKIHLITTNKENGAQGKANALNLALKEAKGEWICVFDADAIPEPNTLKFLILKSFQDDRYAAVFGRNKARNRNRNLLTKFINIELVVSQRILNPGKWHLLKLGQIPGTNFIINRSILQQVGGWDKKALTEDTALGFSLMRKNYLIAYESRAEAYQQEPEKLSVFIKQRTRWAKGNVYVLFKNIDVIFSSLSWRIKFDILLYWLIYIWFLLFILILDGLFIINILSFIVSFVNPNLNLLGSMVLDVDFNYNLSFILMYILFVLQLNVALASDKGQATAENFLISMISYFTYSQLFIFISLRALYSFISDWIFKREAKWYKTERF